MVEFTIKVADHVIKINALFASTEKYCSEYLVVEKPEFCITIEKNDITLEREKLNREVMIENLPASEYSDEYLEITALQRKIAEILIDFDVLVFHGSVVAVDGVAYLFTAKSGTGKSTHTRLWREVFGDRVVMINDDKPFLKMNNEGITAYGSPWNGKHRIGNNVSAPLKSICILQRGINNRIKRISAKDAMRMVFQQSYRPMDKQLLPAYLDLLDRLMEQVIFYQLECNMDSEAALVSYEAMAGAREDDSNEN